MDSLFTFAFQEDSALLFGDVTTTLDNSPPLPPSFGNDRSLPPSRDLECVDYVETTNEYNVPFNIQPEDLFGSVYQPAYAEWYHEYSACTPAEAMGVHGMLQPTPVQYNTSAIAQALSLTNQMSTLVDPSTTANYPQFLDCVPQAPPSPFSGSDTSIPTSPSVSSRSSDSSGSDGDADYLPLSDDEYHPTQAISHSKLNRHNAGHRPNASRHAAFPPTRSISPESEGSITSSRSGRRLHPYKRHVSPRNFQCEDSALFVNGKFSSRCPVVGCDYIQKNRRLPDLKRHVETHGRWREPEKWVCCGVGMDRAHLYDKRFRPGMTDDERTEAGAYDYKGRLMIGGCMKTFSRRDALKRHIDNHKIPCIGHLNSYF